MRNTYIKQKSDYLSWRICSKVPGFKGEKCFLRCANHQQTLGDHNVFWPSRESAFSKEFDKLSVEIFFRDFSSNRLKFAVKHGFFLLNRILKHFEFLFLENIFHPATYFNRATKYNLSLSVKLNVHPAN